MATKVTLKALTRIQKRLCVGAAAVLVAAILLLMVISLSGSLRIDVETSLKEIFLAQEAYTAEYTYNSIAEVTEEDTTKYYVAYQGTVKSGFDFGKIQLLETDDQILVLIPEIEIKHVEVDTNLDYIFLKKRYDTESTYAEAYSFCTQDLTEKASANQTLKTTAEESAIHMVEALLKPFEPHLEEGQTFQILFEADWEEGQK